MSVMMLGKRNYEYLKENIIKYMMSEEGSYTIFDFKYFKPFENGYSNKAFKNFEIISKFVNDNVDYLNNMNLKSFNSRYKETGDKIEYAQDITRDYQFYPNLTDEKLMQLYQLLVCVNYQIEVEYDREFLDKIKSRVSGTLADRMIERYNTQYDFNEEPIKWGL